MVKIGEQRKVEILTQGEKAFEALQKYENNMKKKSLFADDSDVFALIKYKKASLQRARHHRVLIKLPFPQKNSSNSSVCIILPDLNLSEVAKHDSDVDAQARKWAKIIVEKHGSAVGAGISKIYTYTQLTRENRMPSDKSKLRNTYDIFLVENMLLKKVFSFLGRDFMYSPKMPFPVHINSKKFPQELAESYAIVNFSLQALKDSVSITLGNLQQPITELAKNLEEVIHRVFECGPGGHENIRSCYLKIASVSVPLPIYVDFGSANDVVLPMSKKRVFDEAFDYCSTLPEGLAVNVRANGEVQVVSEETGEEVIYPTLEDEWEEKDDLKPSELETRQLILKRARQAMVFSRTTKEIKKDDE